MSPADSLTILYYNAVSAVKAYLQQKHLTFPSSSSSSSSDHQHTETYKKHEVVLLGQGWFAKGFLEHLERDKFRVVNVSTHSFVNTPMLLATVQDSPDAAISRQKHRFHKHIEHFRQAIDEEILAKVHAIDVDNEVVHLEPTSASESSNHNKGISFHNKYLVCGLGSHVDNGIHWSQKIALLQSLPHPTEVVRGLARIQQHLHLPNTANTNTTIVGKEFQNKICIVGAGLTGTELAFYLSDLQYEVTILDGLAHSELYTYLSAAGKKLVLQRLQDKHIQLFPAQLYNHQQDGDKFDLVIFATGARANPLTASWSLNKQFQHVQRANIFAGGDGINHVDVHGQQVMYPRNAQAAYTQGKFVAEQLNRKHRFAHADSAASNTAHNSSNKVKVGVYDAYEHPVDFHYESQGISVYCGDRQYYTEMYLGKSSKYLLPTLQLNTESVPSVALYENVENTVKKKEQVGASTEEAEKVITMASVVEAMPKPWEDYYVQAAAKVPSFVMDLYYNIFK